jgi:hypothetical protein
MSEFHLQNRAAYYSTIPTIVGKQRASAAEIRFWSDRPEMEKWNENRSPERDIRG